MKVQPQLCGAHPRYRARLEGLVAWERAAARWERGVLGCAVGTALGLRANEG